ncbi:MAG: hypothetical protein SGJ20_20285 [Planctomycetota bacterium]|nr:hypothetical protein [Planctomycetota bacterium]
MNPDEPPQSNLLPSESRDSEGAEDTPRISLPWRIAGILLAITIAALVIWPFALLLDWLWHDKHSAHDVGWF